MKTGDVVEVMESKNFFRSRPKTQGVIIEEDMHNNPWVDNWFKWHKVKIEKEIIVVQENKLRLKK